MDLQRKENEMNFKQQQENIREANKLEFQYDKLKTQDAQADERLDVAREKLAQK